MGASKIEQLIDDIYEFIESCKMQPLSSTKVIVPKDELYDLLDELRLRTPDEIKRYQKIIANRDAILSDAREQAETMLAQAQEKTNELINENEIVQQACYQAEGVIESAKQQAQAIIAAANEDAEDIRMGSLSYSEEMLGTVERILANAFESSKAKADVFFESLNGNLDIVKNNRNELSVQLYGQTNDSLQLEQEQAAAGEADFNFDENIFLDESKS